MDMRDHGGHGFPVVLLHGGGRTMDDWNPLIPFLPDLRVVSYNFRPGAWDWRTALADLAAVIGFSASTNPRLSVIRLAASNPTGRVLREFIDEQVRASGDPDLAVLIAAFDELDLIAAYRATLCPLVVVSSTQPEFEQMLSDEVGAAFAVYRREFTEQLAAAAADTPLLSFMLASRSSCRCGC